MRIVGVVVGTTRLRTSFWGLVAAMVIAAPVAEATSVTYYLDQSNVLSDGVNRLTVEIYADQDLCAAGAICFKVDPISGAFTPGTNFGIQRFGFNISSSDPPTTTPVVHPPTGWSVDTDPNISEFGVFDLAVTGNGSNRQSPLKFWIEAADDTLASYFGLSTADKGGTANFVAHVAGFVIPGTDLDSGFFAGGPKVQVVPLPASAWLLLSGVAGLGALARRRRSLAA
jgi:hypothetical protein